VDAGGGVIGSMKYDPWGRVRENAGDLLTDYTYTGQREESALGLMYYVARWYDPHIGHFTQADTIVPGAGNPAAWNRYGYVMYNPLKYVDPSGHFPIGDDIDPSKLFTDEDRSIFDPINVINNGAQNTSLNKISNYHHKIIMEDYSPYLEEIYRENHIFGVSLNPQIFGYDTEASVPISFSVFAETGFSFFAYNWEIGAEIVITNDYDVAVFCYTGGGAGIGLGGAVDIGVELTFEEGLEEHRGPDHEVFIGGSYGGTGITVSGSEDSVSIAWSPGLQLGVGSSVVYKFLFWQIH
jgi:RHS repeat-associated protein